MCWQCRAYCCCSCFEDDGTLDVGNYENLDNFHEGRALDVDDDRYEDD